ncbi:MAG: HAD-IA family hydrolase [Pseudonocardiaceae bacterium]|nr:HAD-IA family hydrolase [Pseudonocardiaceae bacterium]
MPSWVIFDYGGVISEPTAALPSIAQLLGVHENDLTPAYWSERVEYDRGSTDIEFWQSVGPRLGIEVDAELAVAAAKMDTAGWLHTDDDTVELLAELADNGVALALLSNAPLSFAERVRTLDSLQPRPWTRHFRHLMFSGELGVLKPDARIWKALLDQLEAEPADCAFLDDKQPNVDGARDAGMHARLWTGAEDARSWLASLT